MEELEWPLQSPNLNPTKHLGDELEQRIQARPSHPTSGSDLVNAPLEECSHISINTLLNLVESLPSQVELGIAAKIGPTANSTYNRHTKT